MSDQIDDTEEPQREMVDCDRCNGDGGPPDVWDEELNRWHRYICGACGGRGTRWEYV